MRMRAILIISTSTRARVINFINSRARAIDKLILCARYRMLRNNLFHAYVPWMNKVKARAHVIFKFLIKYVRRRTYRINSIHAHLLN